LRGDSVLFWLVMQSGWRLCGIHVESRSAPSCSHGAVVVFLPWWASEVTCAASNDRKWEGSQPHRVGETQAEAQGPQKGAQGPHKD
jgi:hypothetical protein